MLASKQEILYLQCLLSPFFAQINTEDGADYKVVHKSFAATVDIEE